MLWPLPDDFVDDPQCTPAALRGRYVLMLKVLAAVDPAVHDRATLDNLAAHCRVWGMPSPHHPQAPFWARTLLADHQPAGSPGAD